MKPRLLEYLACPACHGALACDAGVARRTENSGDEILEGCLRCDACAVKFAIRGGVPRMLVPAPVPAGDATSRTSTSFGYLWEQTPARPASTPSTYHFEKMAVALDLPGYTGLILDAGCGQGIDMFNHAQQAGHQVIGVELSEGGCETAFTRTAGLPGAHVVQADLRRLPFADATFDGIYSYGVLHHVASPPSAAAELARVARPGAHVSVYLYEDFGERAGAWRWALKAVNRLRVVTTNLPPRLLYVLCQIGSPVVYVLLTVPHIVLRRFRWTRGFADALPYRHGTGPFALAGDLFDRFSAPLEFRYSRRSAGDLLATAGLQVVRVAYERGWMVYARRRPIT
jgi:SAM-dependent methyltransferase